MAQGEHVDRSGFLTENDKRKFTTAAGILGCVFFLVQFAGPMLVAFAVMPAMMFGNGMKHYAVGDAALFRGELYVVETNERFGRSSAEASRSRLVKVGRERLEEVVQLEGWDPDLLADGDRLWLISSSRVSVFIDGSLKALPSPEPLGDICRPFLFRGTPAVVENRPDGGRLSSWTGSGWQTILELPGAKGSCRFQPLVVGDRLWLFRRDGDTLYVQDAMSEDPPDWDVVLSGPSMWYAFTRSGAPRWGVAISRTACGSCDTMVRDGAQSRRAPKAWVCRTGMRSSKTAIRGC